MALIQKLNNVIFTNAAIRELYKDAAISAGTVACYDALDPISWKKQAAAVAGDVLTDLTYKSNDATALGAVAFSPTAGFSVNLGSGQTIEMPTVCNMTSAVNGFVALLHFKGGVQTQALGGVVAGYIDKGDKTGTWGVYWSNPSLYFIINGNVHDYISDGTYHQYALAYVKLPNGAYETRLYVDGVLKSIQASTATISIPTTATTPRIGDGTGTPYFIGNIGRCVLEDLGVAGTDLATTISTDFAENNGRFV